MLRNLLRRKIEHPVGKTAVVDGIPVMQLLRLQHKDRAWSALMLFAPRMKLLYTLLGHANQITVVPVRIIGVSGKMGAQCLDTADGVTAQIDPVC